jgi:hypothetical protein
LEKLKLVPFITAEFVKVLVRLVRFLLLFSVRYLLTQKRGKYSKLLEPEEILMDEDSYEELEEIDERTQSFLSSEDEDNTEETKVMFRNRRAEDSSNVFDFTGPPSGVNRSAAPDFNAESSPLSLFMLFFRQIFQLVLEETNHYFHQYQYDRLNIHIFCNYNSNGT